MTGKRALAFAAAAACFAVAQPAGAQEHVATVETVRLAAGWIDATLRDVAASAEAVGLEFAAALTAAPAVGDDAFAAWTDRSQALGDTTGFRTWPAGAAEPASGAPFAGIYSYDGAPVTVERVAGIAALDRLVPVLRAAYRSLGYSWVYLTTADELMAIYPYVPLAEAVNNGTPTRTPFYTAADVAGRAVGWTAPYLDLVGAGMMITASYPAFDGDTLLGVASRDVTLDELAQGVLGRLAESGGATALLIDGTGLAIGASDPGMAAEIDRVNTAAGAAVLYYRTSANLQGIAGATASAEDWANAAVDRVLAGASPADAVSIESAGQRVLAAQVPSTGWYVVLVEGGNE
ncbi:cache domain-containing protein [Tropicimonas sp. IMCC34043]|uniref:PDC sensor domain-containing protein n=1 Tax=Tropicimonas sp. IMCC34043 TaxID=2248760 RepID=UPI000E286378|nr:cache domain-containing protein [Tropicimonas sp. IMCC34043]